MSVATTVTILTAGKAATGRIINQFFLSSLLLLSNHEIKQTGATELMVPRLSLAKVFLLDYGSN